MSKLTEAQRIFRECVEAEVESLNAVARADGLEAFGDADSLGLYFCFHEPDQVSVDGTLFDVMNYGTSEFGSFSDLREKITEALERAGYVMMNENGCDWRFYEDLVRGAI